MEFPGDGVVFRCNRNDELWFCVHAFFRNTREILSTHCMQVFSLTFFCENPSETMQLLSF